MLACFLPAIQLPSLAFLVVSLPQHVCPDRQILYSIMSLFIWLPCSIFSPVLTVIFSISLIFLLSLCSLTILISFDFLPHFFFLSSKFVLVANKEGKRKKTFREKWKLLSCLCKLLVWCNGWSGSQNKDLSRITWKFQFVLTSPELSVALFWLRLHPSVG